MDALGCQVAVSLMVLSPNSDKGTKSTRIGQERQILRNTFTEHDKWTPDHASRLTFINLSD
jgi:hypothetical protein